MGSAGMMGQEDGGMFHTLWQNLKAFSNTGETADHSFGTQMLLTAAEGKCASGG